MVRAGDRRAIRACWACVRARTSEPPWVAAAGRWERVGGPGLGLEPAPGPEHPAPWLVAGPTQDHVARLFTRGPQCPLWPPPARRPAARWDYGGRVSDRVAVIADPSLSAYNFGQGHPMAPDPGAARPAPGRGLRAPAGAQRRPDPRGRARGGPRPREGPRAGLPDRRAHRRAHRGPRRPEVRDGHRRRAGVPAHARGRRAPVRCHGPGGRGGALRALAARREPVRRDAPRDGRPGVGVLRLQRRRGGDPLAARPRGAARGLHRRRRPPRRRRPGDVLRRPAGADDQPA